MRKKRSSRNDSASIISRRFRFVAQRVVLADPADLAGFEETQQLDLDRLVELADFVEEERAAVGDLKKALAMGVGPGEGPLAVAEQLALDEVLRERSAVDRDEGVPRASALVVEVAGDEFLAGAGLAENHDRGVGRGDGLDQSAD
jgi:hypothetical protein